MSIGGPIIKDKLHFFLTYEAKEFTTPNTVQAPQLFDDNNQEHDWVGALTPELRRELRPGREPLRRGPVLREARLGTRLLRSPRVVGQAPRGNGSRPGPPAWSPSPRHRPTSTTTIAWRCAGSTAASATSTKRPSPTKTRTTRRRRRATCRASSSVALGTGGRRFRLILQIDGVDPRSYFFTTQSGYGLQEDITFTDLSWHGDHTVKAGVKFKDVELQMRDASTEALYSFFVDPAIPDIGVEADPFQVIFGAQADTDLNVTSTSKNRQYGIYLQDDWAVNDKLLLNLGVRYDYEETPTYTDYVTPQRFVDAIFALDTNGCAPAIQNDPARALQLQRRLSRLAARPDLRRHAGECRHRHQRLHQQRQQSQQSLGPDCAAVRLFLRPLRRPGARDLRRRRPELRPQHVQHPAARDQQGDAVRSDGPVLERQQSGLRRPGGRRRPVHRVERRLPDAGGAGVDRPGQLRGDALHQQQAESALCRPVHARHAQPGGRLEHEHRVGVHHELRRRDRKPRELVRRRHVVLVRLGPLLAQ